MQRNKRQDCDSEQRALIVRIIQSNVKLRLQTSVSAVQQYVVHNIQIIFDQQVKHLVFLTGTSAEASMVGSGEEM